MATANTFLILFLTMCEFHRSSTKNIHIKHLPGAVEASVHPHSLVLFGQTDKFDLFVQVLRYKSINEQ